MKRSLCQKWGGLLGIAAAVSLVSVAFGGGQVPIKGKFVTEFAMVSGPPVVQIVVNGAGQASHLGLSQCVSTDETVDFTQGGKMTGTLAFLAANGDKLIARMEALTVPDFPNDVVNYAGTLTFVGGTGRFQNATGSAQFEGAASPIQGPTGRGWFSFAGTVSSPGAGKK